MCEDYTYRFDEFQLIAKYVYDYVIVFMAPKPQNHNPTNIKNGPSRFFVSDYPNKSLKKWERQTGLLFWPPIRFVA